MKHPRFKTMVRHQPTDAWDRHDTAVATLQVLTEGDGERMADMYRGTLMPDRWRRVEP